MAKTSDEIFQNIRDSFTKKAGDEPGAVLDLYSSACAEILADNYEEIEKNKTPHVWSSLEGDKLDATGEWVNVPRDPNESDASYRYRLMRWMPMAESCNQTAIDTRLLNPTYAENLQFVPMTHGCGTGTVYVLPKHYTEDSIKEALNEAQEIMSKCAPPEAYIDYIIPEIRGVQLEIYISSEKGDLDSIRSSLESQIATYINGIAPHDYLEVGAINKMGINTSQVDYFQVLSLYINGSQTSSIKLMQEIETKFIFDSITWIGDND